MLNHAKLRIARPSRNLEEVQKFYGYGLGFEVLSRFEDHDGINGIMMGHKHSPYHFEFTRHTGFSITPSPTKEDLLVFYVPNHAEWLTVTKNLEHYAYKHVESLNPYWDKKGLTFEDPDGYRVVLVNEAWLN